MRKLAVFLLLVFVVFVAEVFYFYQGLYSPPDVAEQGFVQSVPTEPYSSFVDRFGVKQGVVLVDVGHENDFSVSDFNVLFSRILKRGHIVRFLEGSFENASVVGSSLIVISPQKRFTESEVRALESFASKGRLIFFEDPEKKSNANFVLPQFGFFEQREYLYNLRRNNGNFRFVYFDRFANASLVSGMGSLVLYNACHFSPLGEGLVFSDSDTFSSASEVQQTYAPTVLKGNVLAVCDHTFLKEPYNNVADNNLFISRIADFATGF